MWLSPEFQEAVNPAKDNIRQLDFLTEGTPSW
jgi:hypothetical protein